MSSSTGSSGSGALDELIVSTLALLNQFTTSLGTNTPVGDAGQVDNPPDPLRVVGDSAKLIKAHTTKLSLLAINKPFTPSAIVKVLKELAGTCLPAMMSAVQICQQSQEQHGSMMVRELQTRVRRVFRELEMLLGEVQSIGAGSKGGGRRDSLSSTGVVWESCDDLIKLELIGIGGLALQKAEQYRETLRDALKELQEWSEGDDLDSEGQGDHLLDSDDEAVDGDRDSIEDIFNAANSMPKDRPELKALVEDADKKLKKVVILYNALIKRRIQTFKTNVKGHDSTQIAVFRLDKLMVCLKKMPHQVDELASKFYDLDEDSANVVMFKILAEASSACVMMELNWEDQGDEFTAWSQKWSAVVCGTGADG